MQPTRRAVFAAGVLLASALFAVGCARRPETARADEGKPPARQEERPASRRPDVPYEPSPAHVVAEIVKLAALKSGDVVYDLGCGDGRIVIAAVRTPGVRGVCVDIDPERIRESQANAQAAGVFDRIEFRGEDLFQADLAGATVVTLFLWPEVNLRLRPKLERELAPGTRVVSYMHDMGDWAPERSVDVVSGSGRQTAVYLWTIGR